VRGGQGYRTPGRACQARAVAHQEERQVQRDEQARHEVEGVQADGERLRGDDLRVLRGRRDEAGLQRVEVHQAEAAEQCRHPRRQRVEQAADVDAGVPGPGLDLRVGLRRLVGQRGAEQRERQHPDHEHHQHHQGRRQVAPLFQARQQARVQRQRKGGDDHAPQDGGIERQRQREPRGEGRNRRFGPVVARRRGRGQSSFPIFLTASVITFASAAQ
jgi:hypothetical protein